jgi:ribosomal protein L7Ae-like RNA K-turn-binding protein
MNNKTKALSLLGMAMRAGKLITGESLTVDDIRREKTRVAFVANDASENTKKKLKDKSAYYSVPCFLSFSEAELSQAIGRTRKVIGVNDAGFAKKLIELLSE